MRILQISASDSIGGADKVAYDLYRGYVAKGHDSWLAVERKNRADSQIVQVHTGDPWVNFWAERSPAWSILHLRLLNRPFVELGRERRVTFSSRSVPDLTPQPPDVLHLHNLHGWYFDLGALPDLSARIPIVLTLHDAWLLSGHCAHSFECDRWESGCGQCPDLTIYPAVRRDATHENWLYKRRIYQRSRLFVVTPSRWLMDKVKRSMLAGGIVESAVIPNGVDTSIFHPADKQEARSALGLPADAQIVLFAANGIRHNAFKDYKTLREALTRLGEQRPVLCLALGEDAPPEHFGQAETRFIPPISDPHVVAQHYHAADLYVHAARADTFPNTVIEALACGTPVIGTDVSGIPEQITDGETGLLVGLGDMGKLAEGIAGLLDDPTRISRMGAAAADDAKSRFSLERAVRDYLSWYERIAAIT